MSKPIVYIASPYTKGDPGANTHFQCKVFDRLMSDGLVIPYVPLWSHFQHTMFPRPYQDWIEYDNAIIPRLDACIRLDAFVDEINYHEERSTGADNEVKLFKSLNKPVFYSIEDCYAWVKNETLGTSA